MGFRPVDTQCVSSKPGYETGVEADEAAEWAQHRGLGRRWPYLCRSCGHWHVTSRDPELPTHVDHHAREKPNA